LRDPAPTHMDNPLRIGHAYIIDVYVAKFVVYVSQVVKAIIVVVTLYYSEL